VKQVSLSVSRNIFSAFSFCQRETLKISLLQLRTFADPDAKHMVGYFSAGGLF